MPAIETPRQQKSDELESSNKTLKKVVRVVAARRSKFISKK